MTSDSGNAPNFPSIQFALVQEGERKLPRKQGAKRWVVCDLAAKLTKGGGSPGSTP